MAIRGTFYRGYKNRWERVGIFNFSIHVKEQQNSKNSIMRVLLEIYFISLQ